MFNDPQLTLNTILIKSVKRYMINDKYTVKATKSVLRIKHHHFFLYNDIMPGPTLENQKLK